MKEKYIEKSSEEVHDIIERMPTQWTGWIVLTVSFLIGVIFLLGFVIKYPDTVGGQISITSSKAPIRLVAVTSGRIHLLKSNYTLLKKGELIAYIENGANIKDIGQIETLLQQPIDTNTELFLSDILQLGDLSTAYNSFILSYQIYDQLRKSQLYTTIRRTLHQQVQADIHVAQNLEKELKLKEEIIRNIKNTLRKDSLLMEKGGLSKNNYKNQYNVYLSYEESKISLESSYLSRLSNINKNHLELARIDLEENEILQKAYSNLQASRNTLLNALNLWKLKYLMIAPEDGILEYLDFWRENTYIHISQEVFTILPAKNDIIGEVYISSLGAGKVEKGQEANIKLNDYPYDEYGLIKGEIHSISQLTNTISTPNGVIETYLVIVSFPNGLKTNYGKELSVNFETKGTIDIITKPKRLIQRLFDNLKAKSIK